LRSAADDVAAVGMRARDGFALTKSLVVIAIIGLLPGVRFPDALAGN
jgi:hypothetical protein